MPNPKVGTTTVKQLIAEDEGLTQSGKKTKVHGSGIFKNIVAKRFASDLRILVDILNGDYFKFCFVRNPYERLASAYRDKINRKIRRRRADDKKPKSEILQALERDPDDLEAEISFADFIQAIQSLHESVGPRKLDRHWCPQHIMIMADAIDYDFVGRMENFRNDLLSIASRVNLPLTESSMPHRKASPESNRVKTGELIDRRSEKIIQHIYVDDFRRFNYDPDLS